MPILFFHSLGHTARSSDLAYRVDKPIISPPRFRSMEYNKLNQEEEYVLLHKGTEYPFTGEYTDNKASGTYVCRRCNAALYKSEDKFDSRCGWPSFDDEVPGAVRRDRDRDGRRVEILCTNCGAHLGHVFEGERFTAKDTRHCVNSISMRFIPSGEALPPVLNGLAEPAAEPGSML